MESTARTVGSEYYIGFVAECSDKGLRPVRVQVTKIDNLSQDTFCEFREIGEGWILGKWLKLSMLWAIRVSPEIRLIFFVGSCAVVCDFGMVVPRFCSGFRNKNEGIYWQG